MPKWNELPDVVFSWLYNIIAISTSCIVIHSSCFLKQQKQKHFGLWLSAQVHYSHILLFFTFFFVFANNYWCIFCIFCILSTFQIQLILSVLKPLFHPATQLIKNLIKMNNHFRYNIVVAGRNWRINLCTFRSSCSSVGFGFVN